MTSKSAKKESTKKDKEDFSGERQKLKDGFGVQSKSKNNSDTHPLVCNELLRARQNRKETIKFVASKLHIRDVYLTALETGNHKDLPERVYTLGFVRSYADYLGLNHTEITKRFKEEVLGSKDDADLVMPAPLPEEGVPKARILVFAFGLILLALVGWRLWGKEKITKIPRVTLSERSKGETKNFHAKIHQDVHPQMAKTFLQSNSIDIYSKTVAESSKSPEETKVSTVSSKITLRATELSWIEVRTHDGSILLSKTLNPGESQKIPHNEGLLLTTGNAGGITISLAGEQAMPLGNSGEVLRHIPLTKAGISAVSHHYKVKLVK